MSNPDARRLAVAFDTASELAGVCLTGDVGLLAESTWRTKQGHSRELLLTLEWLLARAGGRKEELGAVFICLGPGSYAGLRVGLSTAKTLAYALDVPLVGVGRLAADAYAIALATDARVVTMQAAGRAELAWAAYRRLGEDDIGELVESRLGPIDGPEGFVAALEAGDIVSGDVDKLDEATLALVASRGARTLRPIASRVGAVARLGAKRLGRGLVDDPDSLVPMYLRGPAIGPQPPR